MSGSTEVSIGLCHCGKGTMVHLRLSFCSIALMSIACGSMVNLKLHTEALVCTPKGPQLRSSCTIAAVCSPALGYTEPRDDPLHVCH